MDSPTQNAGAGMPVVQSGMSMRTQILLVVGILLIIAAAVVYFGPRYGVDVGRFFAAEPSLLGPPITNSVKLYPVVDEQASKVQFVLEAGDHEITGFQFRAGISDAAFANVSGLTGSTLFSQILEPAHLLASDTLSFAAGVPAGQPGALSTTTVATIDYSLPADTTAKQVCVTVDMANTIVTAKGVDTNVLDMALAGWSNTACIQLATVTVTPAPFATVQAPLRGDVNGDGRVDIQDFNIVVANFGKSSATLALQGDENNDGKIDIVDFNAIVTFFGTTTI